MTDAALSNDYSVDPFYQKSDIVKKTFVVVKGSYFAKVIRSLEANVYEFDGDDVDAAKFYVEIQIICRFCFCRKLLANVI